MKKFYLSEKFVVRKPYLPYNNHMFSTDEFKELIKNECFQEALYYASPDLYSELKKYLTGTLSEKDTRRMTATLYKYVQRIHFRCTPFGMFSYCSIGRYSDNMNVQNKNVRKHYRYDCLFLSDYVNYLLHSADISFIESLKVCTNQTLNTVGSFYYITVQDANGLAVDMKIKKSELLSFIFLFCKSSVSCEVLIGAILEEFEINRNDVFNYVKKLMLAGILISDIKIGTTGEDNFDRIYRRLKNLHPVFLDNLNHTISVLNSEASFKEKLNEIDTLINKLDSIGLKIKRNMFIQIDSYSDEQVLVDKSVFKQISEWFEILTQISSPSNNPLGDFINRYVTRYENMTMAVLDVLNCRKGIGYKGNANGSSDLIKNIFRVRGNYKRTSKINSYNLSEIEQVVLNKITECGNIFEKDITLTRSDFLSINNPTDCNFSLSYSTIFKIVGYNDNGPIISHFCCSGPSASCLMTRFADSLKEINGLLKDVAVKEQSIIPDVILAEISHLSTPHSGNVQIRPSFRQFEIPLLSNSHSSKSISIQDLKIRIKNGLVSLWSSEFNKEVIPCYSSAFNYKNNTSELYQFLGDISHQAGLRSLTANFTTLLSLLKHLPRICYKNIIVNPESWLIDNFWNNKQTMDNIERFKLLYSKLCMPKFLCFNQGDNYFIIDIEDDQSIIEFFNLAKNQSKIILSEFLPLAEDFNHYDSVIEIVQPILPKPL